MPLLITTQKNRSRRVILRTPPEIDAAIYYIGRIKSGKSCSMRTMLEKYHDIRKCKIVDMGGDERAENLYWCIKSNKEKYWKILEKYLGDFAEPGPKQYKVNLLYPFFKSKLPDELPYNPPFIKSIPFTIPFREITAQQIELVINNMSENAKFAWRELVNNFNKNSTTAELLYKASKTKTISKQIVYKNFIKPLCDELFLQSDNCFLNLNIKKELKDRETISVLCLDFVPEEYHILVSDYILNKCKELFKAGRLNKTSNILFAFREVSRYFRATDMSSQEQRYKKFRFRLSDYLRYARLGMHFFFDTQDMKECKGLVDGQQDMTFIGRIGESESNREALIAPLIRDKRITTKQVEDLKYSESGEMTIVTAGVKSVQPVYVTLPRTMYWEENSGNFYKDVWDKYIGKYENIKNYKDEINNKFKDKLHELKELDRLKKQQEELKEMIVFDEDEKGIILKEEKNKEEKKEINNDIKNININIKKEIEDKNKEILNNNKIEQSKKLSEKMKKKIKKEEILNNINFDEDAFTWE